jgi:predicted nuclease of predicted toxin-antitoxin system
MKLLFDQNLSPKLVSRLADLFPGSSHVQSEGLDSANDDQIWEHAPGSMDSPSFPRTPITTT